MAYLYKYDQGLIDMYLYHVFGGVKPGSFYSSIDILERLAVCWHHPEYAKVEELLILHMIYHLAHRRDGVAVKLNKPGSPSTIGAKSSAFSISGKPKAWDQCPYRSSEYNDLFLCSGFLRSDTYAEPVYRQDVSDSALFRHQDMFDRGLLTIYGEDVCSDDVRLSFYGVQILQQKVLDPACIRQAFESIINVHFSGLTDEQQSSWMHLVYGLQDSIKKYGSLYVSCDSVIQDVYDLLRSVTLAQIPDDKKFGFIVGDLSTCVDHIWYQLFESARLN